MEYAKDIRWAAGITLREFVAQLGSVGFQSIEVARAAQAIVKMKKSGAKILLTFTSNMVTSGLRGLFAQCIEKGMADVVITTVGAIEEDIMKASGEQFVVGSFYADDVSLHEKGLNRVGNLMIANESYARFESYMLPVLKEMYAKKARWTVAEMLHFIGARITDEQSILHQAAMRDVPIFCPAITDGALGFHLYLFQQKHPDFVIDVVGDFKLMLGKLSHDDRKGLIALGGSVSKHHAILAALLSGGLDYAVYISTARPGSGSMSGATTQEAKSWGKIKDDADAVTVSGDASVLFPLAIMMAFEELHEDGVL